MSQGTLEGFVIDGPVTGAEVVVIDAKGDEIGRATTDANARFVVAVPEDAVYPLVVTAAGGVNLTTGSIPDIALRGVVGGADKAQVVVSALSTLVMARAECAAIDNDEFRAQGIQSLVSDPEQAAAFLASHGFGLAPDQYARLLGGRPVTPKGAARLLLASESLVESLRRASAALSEAGDETTEDDLLWAVACDSGGSALDEAARARRRQRMAAFNSAATAVNIEASSGRMRIATLGTDVAALLEQAIIDTFDFDQAASFDSLPLGASFLEALRSNVYAMLAASPSEQLFDLYAGLLAAHPDTPRAEIEAMVADTSVFEQQFHDILLDVTENTAFAEDFLAAANEGLTSPPPPEIAFDATPRKLPNRGGSTSINYEAKYAEVCRRVEGDTAIWGGVSGPSAEFDTGPIEQVTTLRLSCAGPGGIAETSADLTVPPAVNIRFSSTSTEPSDFTALGDLLRIEIEVVDGAQEDCSLFRSDTGAVVDSGDTVVAAPGINFEATCEGPGGLAVTAVSLPVRAARLRWVPPSETEEDEPMALADLAGYRIYHGTEPGHYNEPVITINDPERTEFVDSFPAGTRYFVMTALSQKGVESRLSNEVIRDIP